MLRNSYYLAFLLLLAACRQAYEPPAIKAPNRFLVVDGVINTLPDSKTTIKLSRTKNLSDTLLTTQEGSASVQIEAKSGTVYRLQEEADGVYSADHLSLNHSDLYRLNIHTRDGGQYFSDYVPAKQTPPIDSLTWKQDAGVTIYANTHDPLNNARYYRWDFVETYQYRAFLEANFGLGVANGKMFFLDANTQRTNCWRTLPSTEIILGTSVRLSDDVVDHQPVIVIPDSSVKMAIRYSTLVQQYALTEAAYNYWDILRKNSQTLGTLFDAQPGQLQSNIFNAANAAEPVIGYVSACDVQQKRLFIDHLQLFNWHPPVPSPYCGDVAIARDPIDPFIWSYPDTSYGPWYFVGMSGLMIAKNDCLDCRRQGGTNQKPSFWQ